MPEEKEELEGQIVPLQVLKDIETTYTKADIYSSIVDAIMDGRVEPSKFGVTLRRIQDGIKAVLDNPRIKEIIKDDTQKYIEGKSANILGAKIQLAATYTKYDFTQCGHTELDAIDSIMTQLKERKEQIEDEIKLQLKVYESATGKKSLGVTSTTKTYIIERIPELVWKESGDVIDVRIPQKIQTMGLKYFDL